jgi:hypothetical protein
MAFRPPKQERNPSLATSLNKKDITTLPYSLLKRAVSAVAWIASGTRMQ